MKKLLGLVLAASGLWFVGCGDNAATPQPVAPPKPPMKQPADKPMGDMPDEGTPAPGPKDPVDAPKDPDAPKADAPKEDSKDEPKADKKDE